MRTTFWTCGVILVFQSLLACEGSEAPEFTGVSCEEAIECEDGLYCNGASLCLGGECVNLAPVVCEDGIACTVDVCNEITDRCEHNAPDADDDGVGDASCTDLDGVPLGADCDDQNPRVFRGAVEVCDAEDIDEDCDPSTFGNSDNDGDGLVSNECCNLGANGEPRRCGTDCDDDLLAVIPGAQTCLPDGPLQVRICQADGTWDKVACPSQGACAPQPNGTGVCIP
jgi:hypothetical protein